MKQKIGKKGFTLVELVIVIAVIAVLSAILIPTFGSIIENARRVQAYDSCKQSYNEYRKTNLLENVQVRNGIVLTNGEYAYAGMNGELKELTKLGTCEINGTGDEKYILSGVISYDGKEEVAAVYEMPFTKEFTVYSLAIDDEWQYLFFISEEEYEFDSATGYVRGFLDKTEGETKRYLSAYGKYEVGFNPIEELEEDLTPFVYYVYVDDNSTDVFVKNYESVVYETTEPFTYCSFGVYDGAVHKETYRRSVVSTEESVSVSAADFDQEVVDYTKGEREIVFIK